jgi:hypothetical membrane protein
MMRSDYGRILWSALIISLILTPLSAVIVRVLLGRFDGPWFMISDLGTTKPEAYLFAIGSIVSSTIAFISVVYLWRKNEKSGRLSLALLFFGSWAFGMALVGIFPSNTATKMHLAGSIITFTSLPAAALVMANWSAKTFPSNDSRKIIGGYILPLITIITTMIFHLSHEFAHQMHPDVDKMIEMGNEVGWFALFTTLEWILGLIFVLVVMSWKPLFQKPLLEH